MTTGPAGQQQGRSRRRNAARVTSWQGKAMGARECVTEENMPELFLIVVK